MTPPTTSPVKVRHALAQLAAQLPELQRQASGMTAVMTAPLMVLAPRLEAMAIDAIPQDPAQLDAILERVAAMVLELRSDAPAIDVDAVHVLVEPGSLQDNRSGVDR
jgi:hypothetical protein